MIPIFLFHVAMPFESSRCREEEPSTQRLSTFEWHPSWINSKCGKSLWFCELWRTSSSSSLRQQPKWDGDLLICEILQFGKNIDGTKVRTLQFLPLWIVVNSGSVPAWNGTRSYQHTMTMVLSLSQNRVQILDSRHNTHRHFTTISWSFRAWIQSCTESFTNLLHSSFKLITLEENDEHWFVDIVTLKRKIENS